MDYLDTYNTNENVIEWLTGQGQAAITASQRKLINRLRKLHQENPDEVVLINNTDGSVFAKVPVDWVKIKKPTKRELTDEERQEMAATFKARIEGSKNNE